MPLRYPMFHQTPPNTTLFHRTPPCKHHHMPLDTLCSTKHHQILLGSTEYHCVLQKTTVSHLHTTMCHRIPLYPMELHHGLQNTTASHQTPP
ncbi:hypothetical protein L208DRAFT_551902 [Tricholoma matsutake]|nr:hypothetical protein L208DRAFT_551902 [Tricholoma matsutake 945]